MLSFAPLSSIPLSALPGGQAISAALALAPSKPVFSFTDIEDFVAVVALAPAIPVFIASGNSFFASGSLTLAQPASSILITDAEDFIIAAISLTQPGSSTILIQANHNSLTQWQAPLVDNTRKRQQTPALKELRQTAPSLKQLRQTQPVLGD
jgi:hypothetical protein